jgi:hypothetical protein
MDMPLLANSQNPCKTAYFADGLVRAKIYHFRLLISRFQVRVLGGSLLVRTTLSPFLPLVRVSSRLSEHML